MEPDTHTSDPGVISGLETDESRRLREKPEISGPQRPDETAGLEELFANEHHESVALTWSVYQRIVDAYRQPDKKIGRWALERLMDLVKTKVPQQLSELASLGRTLKRRSGDILAYFDRKGTSNGLTEAISGMLEHLRGSTLGFRNLADYIARSLFESGGFRPVLHSGL